MRKQAKLSEGDIILVTWEDSHGKTPSLDGHFSWITESELQSYLEVSIEVESIGRVYQVNDRFVCLVATKAKGSEQHEPQYGDYIMIPLSSIINTKTLEKASG